MPRRCRPAGAPGALAVAAALRAAIWLRRHWFASPQTKGFSSTQLMRPLIWESAIVLGVGGYSSGPVVLAAAIIGDAVNYSIGRSVGRQLVRR